MSTTAPPPRTSLAATALAALLLLATALCLDQSTAMGSTTATAAVVVPAAVRGAVPAPVPGSSVRFEWPLAAPHPLLRPFQLPTTPYGPGHRGVDLGGQVGEQILAAGDGLVLYAGPLADRSLVSIEHPGGLRTTYEPVHPTVRVGQTVQRGQVIGELMAGHPGCPATAPTVCLHWGAHRQTVYLDPLRLVETDHVRLLAWPTTVP
jgi:murein DD-endopeptidase MepM/ murein hydrolase activator NlpD